MRKLLALVAILGLLVAGTVLWTGRQAGRLPGWYEEARDAGEIEPDIEAAARRAQQSLVGRFGRELLDDVTADDGTPDESFLDRVARRGKMVLEGLRQGREVRLEAVDLENLILATAHDSDRGRELLAATRAVRAEIFDDELELGVVVAPRLLPAAALSTAQRGLLDLLLRLAGSDGEVYVSLRAAPVAADDRLRLGPPVEVRAGDLRLSTALLSGLGIEAPELDDGLMLDVGRVKVRQVTIAEGALVLVVSPEV